MKPHERTRAILRSKIEPSHRLMLVAISDFMLSSRETAWPSAPMLAERTGYCERQVREILGSLEARGVIERAHRGHRAPEIVIRWGRLGDVEAKPERRGGRRERPGDADPLGRGARGRPAAPADTVGAHAPEVAPSEPADARDQVARLASALGVTTPRGAPRPRPPRGWSTTGPASSSAPLLVGHEAAWEADRDRRAACSEAERAAVERLHELRTMPYTEYLRTPEWQERRMVRLRSSKFRCQVCNDAGQLDVHHRTYERRGAERADDLVVLCRRCHELFHETSRVVRP